MKKNYLLNALFLGMMSFTTMAQDTTQPHLTFTPVTTPVLTHSDVPVTISLSSMGQVDQITSVRYTIYHNDEVIELIEDFGSVQYTIRTQSTNYHTAQLTEGTGSVSFTMMGVTAQAFSMGILDSYCVNRNRPIDMNLRFVTPGTYRVVVELIACEEDGIPTFTNFTANTNEGCDGALHQDRIATSCTNPTLISTSELEFEVELNPSMPTIDFAGLLENFLTGEDVSLTGNIHSNGYTDPLCGLRYELKKDGEVVTAVSEVADLTLSVRQEGAEIFEMSLVDGSGMFNFEAAGLTVGAFSLGILDNDCVERNRPVTIAGQFTSAGEYTLKTELVGCAQTPIALGSSYYNECTEEMHNDYYAEACTMTERLFESTQSFFVAVNDVSVSKVNTAAFKVYPTVVDSKMNIDVSKGGELKVSNGLGQVVIAKTIAAGLQHVNISDLKEGVYFVEMNGTMQRIIKK